MDAGGAKEAMEESSEGGTPGAPVMSPSRDKMLSDDTHDQASYSSGDYKYSEPSENGDISEESTMPNTDAATVWELILYVFAVLSPFDNTGRAMVMIGVSDNDTIPDEITYYDGGIETDSRAERIRITPTWRTVVKAKLNCGSTIQRAVVTAYIQSSDLAVTTTSPHKFTSIPVDLPLLSTSSSGPVPLFWDRSDRDPSTYSAILCKRNLAANFADIQLGLCLALDGQPPADAFEDVIRISTRG